MGLQLVTGATGLIGSEIAQQLIEGGHQVAALVRPGTDAAPLEALGVRIVRGDLTDAADVRAAAEGCEGIFHSGAAVATASQDAGAAARINVGGTRNVLEAARVVGVRRVVAISSPDAFDRSSTLTERTEPLLDTDDVYQSTKRGAFLAAMEAADRGQDVVVVLPGGTYGPTPMGERIVNAYGANQRLANALRGLEARYLPMVAPWSSTTDVAGVSIAAFERGTPGHRYLGLGAPDCVRSIAGLVNEALDVAGLDHRVGEYTIAELDDPAVAAQYPPTVVERSRSAPPSPMFDASVTASELGYTFVPLRTRLAQTIDWLRREDLL